MKKGFFIGLVAALLLFAAGCETSTPTTTSDNSAQDTQSTTQTTAASNTSSEEENDEISNKGIVDDKYEVEILSYRIANDYSGSPCIVVSYNFTNNSDKNAAMLTSISANAFQNSVECETAVMPSDVMDSQPSLAQVQPGGTVTVECAYVLKDTTNPVTIQVGPLFSLDGAINVQTEFDIAQ